MERNKNFGEILSKLNSKVNKRSSYIHNSTFKYHDGFFAHKQVLSNIKNELYIQASQYSISVSPKYRDCKYANSTQRVRKASGDSLDMPLRATLAKFYVKSPNNRVYRYIRNSNKAYKYSVDASSNMD